MTDIPFEFQGFTLKQCEILSSLNIVLEVNNDPFTKEAHINLIYSRFTGPRLDKHWNGIKLEFVQLFSDLKAELSEEQWLRAPKLVLGFIENFSEFTKLKEKFDLAVTARDLADKIEREKQLAQASTERVEAEAKARLKSVKVLGDQLAQENAENRKTPSRDDYCKGCGQLLPPYYECYCG